MVKFKGLDPKIEKLTLAVLNDEQLRALERGWREKIVNPFARNRKSILQDVNNLEVTPWAGAFHYGSTLKRSALMKKYGNVERPKRTPEEIQLTVKKAKLSQIHKAYKTTGLFNEKELKQLEIPRIDQVISAKKEALKRELLARELLLEVSMLSEDSALAKFLKNKFLSGVNIQILEDSTEKVSNMYAQPKKFRSVSELLEAQAQKITNKEEDLVRIVANSLDKAERSLKEIQTAAHANANVYNKKVKKFYLTGMPNHRSMNEALPVELQKFYNLALV